MRNRQTIMTRITNSSEPARSRTSFVRPSNTSTVRIFASYCHRDVKSLRRLVTMLAPAIRKGTLDCWDDRRIGTGANWRRAIDEALERADVAVLLVTSDFLASTFIVNQEIPVILQAHEERGLGIVWVPVGPGLYQYTPLAAIQAATDPGRPLTLMAGADRDAAWAEVAMRILEVAERSTGVRSRRAHAPDQQTRPGGRRAR